MSLTRTREKSKTLLYWLISIELKRIQWFVAGSFFANLFELLIAFRKLFVGQSHGLVDGFLLLLLSLFVDLLLLQFSFFLCGKVSFKVELDVPDNESLGLLRIIVRQFKDNFRYGPLEGAVFFSVTLLATVRTVLVQRIWLGFLANVIRFSDVQILKSFGEIFSGRLYSKKQLPHAPINCVFAILKTACLERRVVLQSLTTLFLFGWAVGELIGDFAFFGVFKGGFQIGKLAHGCGNRQILLSELFLHVLDLCREVIVITLSEYVDPVSIGQTACHAVSQSIAFVKAFKVTNLSLQLNY